MFCHSSLNHICKHTKSPVVRVSMEVNEVVCPTNITLNIQQLNSIVEPSKLIIIIIIIIIKCLVKVPKHFLPNGDLPWYNKQKKQNHLQQIQVIHLHHPPHHPSSSRWTYCVSLPKPNLLGAKMVLRCAIGIWDFSWHHLNHRNWDSWNWETCKKIPFPYSWKWKMGCLQ